MTSIFLIMAHPDDAFVWCGGLILECLKLNAEITITSLSPAPDAIEKKISEVASTSGFTYQSFSKKSVDKNEICDLLVKCTPDLVITHWADDTHDYHRETALLAALSMTEFKFERFKEGCEANLRVLQCDTYYSIGQDGLPFPGRIILDISESFRRKVQILRAIGDRYISIIERMVKVQNAFYGGKIGTRYAEAFLESSSLASIGGGLGRATARNLVDRSGICSGKRERSAIREKS